MIQTAVAMQAGYRRNSSATLTVNNTTHKSRMSKTPPSVKVTWSTIEVEGERLSSDLSDVSIAIVVEALKMAASHEKDEVIIANIAPGVAVGTPDVADCQARVEGIVTEAAARIGADAPVMRLSLRGKEYDLRCYVGALKPSDYEFNT